MAMMAQVSDMGVMANSMIATIAAGTVATIATVASTTMAMDILDIANREYKLAKRRWDRFAQNYIPCERRAIGIACSMPHYTALYASTRGIYVAAANRNYALINLGLTSKSLCTPPEINQRIALDRTETIVDLSNMAYRTEEDRVDARNDVRWNQRASLLNLGRDLNSFQAQSTKLGVDMLDSVQNTVSSFGQGAAELAGYTSARQQRQFEVGGASTGNRESNNIFPVINANMYSSLGGHLSADVAYNQNKAITAAT